MADALRALLCDRFVVDVGLRHIGGGSLGFANISFKHNLYLGVLRGASTAVDGVRHYHWVGIVRRVGSYSFGLDHLPG